MNRGIFGRERSPSGPVSEKRMGKNPKAGTFRDVSNLWPSIRRTARRSVPALSLRAPKSGLHQQRDLLARAVDAFDEDAFDVGGFGGAGGPDDVRATARCGLGAEGGDGVGDAAVDLTSFEHGDVDPWRQRREAMRGAVVVENERAGLGDCTAGTSDAELIALEMFAVVSGFDRETGSSKLAADGGHECRIAVTGVLSFFFEKGGEFVDRAHGLAIHGFEVA